MATGGLAPKAQIKFMALEVTLARFAMYRTIRFHKFGPAEVLKCEEHAATLPAPGEVQVRVEAIGIS
eukprot:gene12948-16493_t